MANKTTSTVQHSAEEIKDTIANVDSWIKKAEAKNDIEHIKTLKNARKTLVDMLKLATQ